jgi:DNA helicase-2/ATP-dependent DNA helicase PcrA
MRKVRDFLSELNDKQKEVVLATEGPVLVLAGAGSGKTRALTFRLAYLVREKQVSPWNILAVTFTNKAANEMKARVAALLTGQGRMMQGERRDIEINLPWLGTFHSICAKILRKEIGRIGYKQSFAIYDEDDQISVVKMAMKELGIDVKQYAPSMMLAMISAAKNELITPDDYDARSSSYFEELVGKVYRLYQHKLKENHALDFDDLIMKTVELFESNPDVLARYQKAFKYILIDEYQDTNHAQYRLVEMLADKYKNICVVGDPDQAIYMWRGADIRNILDFEKKYKGCKVIKMEQNYRSTKNIIKAAQSVIKHNIQRKEKELWTENEEGLPIEIYEAFNEREEAEFVVREIERLISSSARRSVSLNDFVVLYRTNAQSRVLEEICLHYGMPYRIVGGVRFYERREIKDVLAYLRILRNPSDWLSLKRIINIPSRGISEKTVQVLEKNKIPATLVLDQSFWENQHLALGRQLNPRAIEALKNFAILYEEMLKKSRNLNIIELIEYILDKTGYKEWQLQDKLEGEERLENIHELVSLAGSFADQSPETGLDNFLAEVALMTDLDREADREAREGKPALTLMTMHNAKGLEFPVVFMIGMEEGLFPHSRSLMDQSEMEEERRLCYVGMTRAKKRLYLVYAQSRLLYGGISANEPSRFLLDIPEELVNKKLPATRIFANEANDSKNGSILNDEDFSCRLKTKSDNFSPGDKVRHNKFGEGIIVSIKDLIATVAFVGKGVKKLDLSIAPLKKVKNKK